MTPSHRYNNFVIASLIGCVIVMVIIWIIQAAVYLSQDMSLIQMLAYELSYENPEFKSVYWALLYPFANIILALSYRLRIFTSYRFGSILLAVAVTITGCSSFVYAHWALGIATCIPAFLSWIFVIGSNFEKTKE